MNFSPWSWGTEKLAEAKLAAFQTAPGHLGYLPATNGWHLGKCGLSFHGFGNSWDLFVFFFNRTIFFTADINWECNGISKLER